MLQPQKLAPLNRIMLRPKKLSDLLEFGHGQASPAVI